MVEPKPNTQRSRCSTVQIDFLVDTRKSHINEIVRRQRKTYNCGMRTSWFPWWHFYVDSVNYLVAARVNDVPMQCDSFIGLHGFESIPHFHIRSETGHHILSDGKLVFI
jgi:hypothetical protein